MSLYQFLSLAGRIKDKLTVEWLKKSKDEKREGYSVVYRNNVVHWSDELYQRKIIWNYKNQKETREKRTFQGIEKLLCEESHFWFNAENQFELTLVSHNINILNSFSKTENDSLYSISNSFSNSNSNSNSFSNPSYKGLFTFCRF